MECHEGSAATVHGALHSTTLTLLLLLLTMHQCTCVVCVCGVHVCVHVCVHACMEAQPVLDTSPHPLPPPLHNSLCVCVAVAVPQEDLGRFHWGLCVHFDHRLHGEEWFNQHTRVVTTATEK